jgi:hypothetical protein
MRLVRHSGSEVGFPGEVYDISSVKLSRIGSIDEILKNTDKE